MASTIFTLALAPMRVAPAAVMACRSCKRADAAGRLDAHVRTHHAAHQRDIVRGGAGGAEAGGCLDEIRARQLAQGAGHGLLVVVQQRRLQNHLDDGAGVVRHLHHLLDIQLHRFVIARAQRADVDHHVDFLRARRAAPRRSPPLSPRCWWRPAGKPTTVHTLTRRSGQFRAHQRHPVGIHADAGEAVLARLAADLDHVGARGVGLENGVVDQRGDGGIDLRQPFSLAETRSGARGDDLLGIARAGLRDSAARSRGRPGRAG